MEKDCSREEEGVRRKGLRRMRRGVRGEGMGIGRDLEEEEDNEDKDPRRGGGERKERMRTRKVGREACDVWC